jgi:hypothetical protein
VPAAAAKVAGHRSSGHPAGVWDCVIVFGLLFSCHCWEWRWVPGWARLPARSPTSGSVTSPFGRVREQVTPETSALFLMTYCHDALNLPRREGIT